MPPALVRVVLRTLTQCRRTRAQPPPTRTTDAHTHTRTQTLHSGQAAMLAGGTTMHIDFALPTHHDLRAGLAAWRHKANAGCADYGLHMAVTSWNDKVRGVCVGWCCAAALCCCAAVLLRCVLRCVLCGVLRAVVLRAVLCVLIHDETRAWWQSTSPPPRP